MWCVALLVNTSTWEEMIHNWKLICYSFLQIHIGNDDVNREYYASLLNKISKIRADPNIFAAIETTEPKVTESVTNYGAFDYDDNDENQEDDEEFLMSMCQNTSSKTKNNKVCCLTNKPL